MRTRNALVKTAIVAFFLLGFYKIWMYKAITQSSDSKIAPKLDRAALTSESFSRVIAEFNAPKLILDVGTERSLAKFVLSPKIITNPSWKTSNRPIRWTAVNAVKSAPGNSDRRNAIRQTWGSIKFLNGVRFETVFVIGQIDDNILQEKIRKEHEIFGDIAQTDIPDTKQNVPLKTLATLQWAAENVPEEWIFSSTDDDMVLHPNNFLLYVDKIIVGASKETGRNISGLPEYDVTNLPIMCIYSYQPHDPPSRDSKSKWYMPTDLYPPKAWPPYCRGGWYTMAMSVVTGLHKISRKTRYLHLDDVWITGIMRLKLLAEDKDFQWKISIVTAPLASRDDRMLIDHVGEDKLEEVIVSHMWGNIKSKEVDVSQNLMELWKKWEPSVLYGQEDYIQIDVEKDAS